MPQIEVEEVQNPDVNAQIMAERLAYSLDRGRHFRREGYYILRKVMDSGEARGVEIIVSGKVTSQRARTQIFRAGTMSKSGQPAQEGVDKGVAQCVQKSGTLGIIVKIMRADTRMGDTVKLKREMLSKAQTKAEAKLAKTRAEYKIEEAADVELSVDDKELLDKVDEEDISEISLKPDDKDEDGDDDDNDKK